jgi:hypothetical protein
LQSTPYLKRLRSLRFSFGCDIDKVLADSDRYDITAPGKARPHNKPFFPDSSLAGHCVSQTWEMAGVEIVFSSRATWQTCAGDLDETLSIYKRESGHISPRQKSAS